MLNVNIYHKDGALLLLSSESENSESRDLLTVKYLSVDRTSPQFESIHNSVGQDVTVNLSTMIFQVSPEPIIAVYDFLMTTFVNRTKPGSSSESQTKEGGAAATEPAAETPSKMKIGIRLEAFRGVCIRACEILKV
jgi:vacuolar protein sorting-associated protein 13A/C